MASTSGFVDDVFFMMGHVAQTTQVSRISA